jgi:hypothetical protein
MRASGSGSSGRKAAGSGRDVVDVFVYVGLVDSELWSMLLMMIVKSESKRWKKKWS